MSLCSSRGPPVSPKSACIPSLLSLPVCLISHWLKYSHFIIFFISELSTLALGKCVLSYRFLLMVHKQDGKWSWLVCFSATLSWLGALGFLFSFGIFFPMFMDYFHESREKTGKLQALHVDAIYSCRRHNKPSGKKTL